MLEARMASKRTAATAALELLNLGILVGLSVYAFKAFPHVAAHPYTLRSLVAANGIAALFFLSRFIQALIPNVNRFNIVALPLFHVFAMIGIWQLIMFQPKVEGITRLRVIRDAAILYVIGGIGITAGAHRMWAHCAYKANLPYRFLMMICNSVAHQGTIHHWARDHRVHHRYSEKEADPHNAKKGFFYSHMGWLLLQKSEAVIQAGRQTDMTDLEKDMAVMLQKTLHPWWNSMWCFVLPTLYGHYVYGDVALGFFVLAALRWVWTLHCTWTVNSVAHLWGPRPYHPTIGPVESFVTALLACGEGWHNWHHMYAFDYATSEHGALRQYNPTKVFIDFFAWLGWVWDRKRATHLWEATKKQQAERQRSVLEALSATPKDVSYTTPANEEKQSPEDSSLFSVNTMVSLIPESCYKLSLLRSTIWLLRDALAVVAVSATTAYLCIFVSRLQMRDSAAPHIRLLIKGLMGALFSVYSLAQGTVMMALWVAVYESAGGRFCPFKWLNGIIGTTLSVILCIPYQGRRGVPSNKVHRRFPGAAHLCRALYEDVFSIFNVWRWTSLSASLPIPLGGLTGGLSVSLLAMLIRWTGWRNVACWYLGPWIVMNFWLLLYHHLLLVKVHRAFNCKHSVNTCLNPMAMDDSPKTTEEILKDVVDDGEETEQGDIPETISVDPHSIATMQQEMKPLSRASVEFFTREWLLSAMEVFERTVIVPKATASQDAPLCHVRFVVRVLLFLFGSLHHHLSAINILQSVDISIPHYHAREALHALRLYIRAGNLIHQKAREVTGGKSRIPLLN